MGFVLNQFLICPITIMQSLPAYYLLQFGTCNRLPINISPIVMISYLNLSGKPNWFLLT